MYQITSNKESRFSWMFFLHITLLCYSFAFFGFSILSLCNYSYVCVCFVINAFYFIIENMFKNILLYLAVYILQAQKDDFKALRCESLKAFIFCLFVFELFGEKVQINPFFSVFLRSLLFYDFKNNFR